MTEPSADKIARHLRAANAIAQRALDAGHHPFGALLVGADHETVLLEQGNVDGVNHAEAVLARTAAARWSPAELWECTLYTTVEPCVMCAGTQYWAHIGRVVYGMAEHALLAQLGCRHVQGYGIARPMPVEDLAPWLAAHRERRAQALRIGLKAR